MESIEITYFRSSLCPNMLFDSKEDAENFDETLKRYSESSEAEKEFKKAVKQYPSPYAVVLAIKQNRFHFNLVGEHSKELIIACENMICGYNGLADDECYICAMNYLYNKFYYEKSNEKKQLEIVMIIELNITQPTAGSNLKFGELNEFS